MNKLKNKKGMTLAEMLIVVAIIVVLAGVSFIAVQRYRRSLGLVERDGIAKEIFVAAQNHLTALYGGGYYGITDEGSFGTPGTAEGDSTDGVYYFTVNGSLDENSVIGQMLPFGAIDETVRIGGSYIIRYQKDTGLVLDVFYCSRNGSPAAYNYSLTDGDYTTLLGIKEDRSKRLNWNEHIAGWYGGTKAASLGKIEELKAPAIQIKNEEMLYVEVADPNSSIGEAAIKLIVTGMQSNAKIAYKLVSDGKRILHDQAKNKYTVILDDITISGMHFGDIIADTVSTTGEKFIPGEDIQVQAVAYSSTHLANVAYSASNTANSLFGSINTTRDTAFIGNIRHLENLDKSVSGLDNNDTDKLNVKNAIQTDSFSWIGFQKGARLIETGCTGTPSESGYESIHVYGQGLSSPEGCYMPISPDYALTYDGDFHSISDVTVKKAAYAGLIGSSSRVSEIKNLELIDFSIKENTLAGTLAGKLEGCKVTNVLARNSSDSETVNVDGSVSGGLVGSMTDGTISLCAAAVIVNGSTTAGGLLGEASCTVSGCFSGGHTKDGSYDEWVKNKSTYDVTGGITGGLVGNYTGSGIEYSYSTCSVKGSTAGGFAGSAKGNIKSCYATGLVKGGTSDDNTGYAFYAAGSPSLSKDYYYSIVNMIPVSEESTATGKLKPMLPYSGYEITSANLKSIAPLDLNTDSYNEFTGEFTTWHNALVYDPELVSYYSGKYCLKTVEELGAYSSGSLPTGYTDVNQLYVNTHYGDWPSPEVFFINK